MADKNTAVRNRIREVVANAYGFVMGADAVQSFQALTFEEVMRWQVDRLEGKPSNRLDGYNGRTPEVKRVEAVRDQLKKVIVQIKAMPDDAFKVPEGSSVNTKA